MSATVQEGSPLKETWTVTSIQRMCKPQAYDSSVHIVLVSERNMEQGVDFLEKTA